jgi:hypothetical protein
MVVPGLPDILTHVAILKAFWKWTEGIFTSCYALKTGVLTGVQLPDFLKSRFVDQQKAGTGGTNGTAGSTGYAFLGVLLPDISPIGADELTGLLSVRESFILHGQQLNYFLMFVFEVLQELLPGINSDR